MVAEQMDYTDTILQAQRGSQEATEAVLRKYIRFARMIAFKYRECAAANGAVDADDLGQLASLGVIISIRLYDPSKGTFMQHINFIVRQLCRKSLGLVGRIRKEWYMTSSLDAPIGEDDPDGDTLESTIEDTSLLDPSEIAHDNELHAAINAALDNLPARQADIIRRHDLQGETIGSIAESYERSIQAMSADRKLGFRCLRHNQYLRELESPDYTLHIGIGTFQRTGMSSVEIIANRHLGLEGYGIDEDDSMI